MSKSYFYQNILETIRENYCYPLWAVYELLDNVNNSSIEMYKDDESQINRLICTFKPDNSILYCDFAENDMLINTLVIENK